MKSLQSRTQKLTASIDDGIATLTINNPDKRNALDLAMWQAIPDLVQAIETDVDARVLLLRGVGKTPFASGADISEFETVRASAEGGRIYEAANEAAFAALANCSKPVVAMIRGFCMGGGIGIAAACDLRIAAKGTQFAVPAARLGVGYPPRAMRMLVAAFGAAAAKDLFFTARRLDADEALRLGLVHRVFDEDALEAETETLVAGIASNAPLTILAAKAAIAAASGLPDAPDDKALVALAEACFDSADYAEGRTAFLEKRKPHFSGV